MTYDKERALRNYKSGTKYIFAAIFTCFLIVLHDFSILTPKDEYVLGYCIGFTALTIAAIRGGIFSLAFICTLLVFYPLLPPLLIQDWIGFPLISFWEQNLQTIEYTGPAVYLGSIACLFLSIFTTTKIGLSNLKPVSVSAKEKPWLILLIIGALGALLFAYITEPGAIIGAANYSEIVNARLQGTAFAGAAYSVFLMVAYYAYLNIKIVESVATQKVAFSIFIGVVVITFLWLLLHARRSEITGLIVLFLITDGHKYSEKVKFLFSFLITFFLTAVAYVRNFDNPIEMLKEDFFQLPGAPANVLISFLGSLDIKQTLAMDIAAGETYLRYLVNFPPEALGFYRISTPTAILEEYLDFMGGEYILVEPYLNFGVWGLVIFLPILVWLINSSVRSLDYFRKGYLGMFQFLVGTNFIISLFRLFWYGGGATYRSFTLVVLITPFIIIFIKMAEKLAISRKLSANE